MFLFVYDLNAQLYSLNFYLHTLVAVCYVESYSVSVHIVHILYIGYKLDTILVGTAKEC